MFLTLRQHPKARAEGWRRVALNCSARAAATYHDAFGSGFSEQKLFERNLDSFKRPCSLTFCFSGAMLVGRQRAEEIIQVSRRAGKSLQSESDQERESQLLFDSYFAVSVNFHSGLGREGNRARLWNGHWWQCVCWSRVSCGLAFKPLQRQVDFHAWNSVDRVGVSLLLHGHRLVDGDSCLGDRDFCVKSVLDGLSHSVWQLFQES